MKANKTLSVIMASLMLVTAFPVQNIVYADPPGSETGVDLIKTAITTTPIKMIYGQTEIPDSYASVTGGYDGTLSYSVTSGDDVISLDNASSGNLITAKKSGTAVIHVTAPATTSYTEASADITVTVSKKDLVMTQGDIDKGTYTAKKTYDGLDTISVTGTIIVDDQSMSYTGTASILALSAGGTGSGTAMLYDLVLTDYQNMYNVTLSQGITINVSVKKCPVNVSVSDKEISYGSSDWTKLKSGNYSSILTKDVIKGLVSINDDSLSESLKKEANAALLDAVSLNIVPDELKNTGYAVGTYSNSLSAAFDDDASTNFKFTANDANITISTETTPDDDALWDRIENDKEKTAGTYTKGDTTYISKDGYVTYKVKDNDLYDSVAIRINDSYSDKITGTEPNGFLTGTFYLYNKEWPSTRTDSDSSKSGTQDNVIPENTLCVDTEAPTVYFNNEKAVNLTDETASDLSFNEFMSDKTPTIKGKYEDELSGVKNAAYVVFAVGEDDLSESLISLSNKFSKGSWKSGDVFSLSEIKDDGYYVLLTRVEDNVGNISYQAYGIIKDTEKPNVTVNGLTDNGFYNDDVNYSISLSDMADAVSGLSKISVEVTADGKKATSDKTYTNSFELNQEDIDALIGTDSTNPADKDSLGKEITLNACIGKELNCSDIKVKITVTDRTGNTADRSYTVNMDTDKPVVDVSYDNNNVKNDTFFKDTREATIKITERSYDEDAVTFTIGVDGKTDGYSLSDLKEGKVTGVSFVNEKKSGDVITYTLLFGAENEEHDYTFDVSLTDKAGNKSEPVSFADGTEAGKTFTVDMVPVKAAMAFKAADGKELSVSDVVTYCSQKVNASIYIKESDYDASEATATVKQTDSAGNVVAAYDVSNLLEVLQDTSLEKNAVDGDYVLPAFEKDANYTISLSLYDKAGNKTDISDLKLTVDTTAPTGSITVTTDETNGTYTGTSKNAKFSHISNSQALVDAVYADATSGVAKVEYYIYTPAEDASGTFTVPDATALSDDVWKTWSGQITLNTEGQGVAYLKITDNAGNICYINANDGTIIDKTAPSAPQINLTTGDENTFFNSDVPFTFSVTDPTSGGTYAGLKSVSYEILKDGVVTQSNTYSFNDKTQRVKSAGYSETVSAAKNNSNHVTIRVSATDYAGNTSTAEKSVKIDITAPRIEVSYDSTTDNGYYNNTRTATVYVYERNFDPDSFKLDIGNALGANAEVGTWSLASEMGESDDALSTLKVAFTTDDDYTLTASVTDKAGNSASLGRTDKFTIDKTIPVVSIAFDKNTPSNGRYYNSARTATITVKDRNFDPSKFALSTSASLAGKAISAPSISSWSGSGDTHTATITFNSDGDYSFSCNAGDLAGNVSAEEKTSMFTIDFVKPVITIEGIEDKSAYNGELTPVISYADLNLGGATNATITLSGERHETKTLTGSVAAITNGWRVLLSDIEKSRDTDDVYTLTVTATDLAGNVETKSVTFSVNRYGSNFTYDDDTKVLLDSFYLQSGKDLVIYETNVNEITHRSITIGINGVTKTLKEGTDYKVKESTTEGWKVYTYTIFKDNFEEEGIYEIVITSTDAAGNTQDNKLKDLPISLAIDKTAPTVVISGITDGEMYNAVNKEVTFTVSDNLATGTLDIYLDGKLTKSFAADELSESNGAVTITVDEANGYQEIYAVAHDAAGNEATSDTCRFLISSNALTRFFYNRPLFIGSIAAVIAALLLIVIFVKKRREKDNRKAVSGKTPTEDFIKDKSDIE